MSNEIVKNPAGFVQKLEQSFAQALPTHITKEHFSRALLTEFRRNPKLLECDEKSIAAGVMTFAQLGLMLGVNGAGWLIPFKHEATVIIGYQGLVDLCYRSGRVKSIFSDEVYENDVFKYQLGLNPILEHTPNIKSDRGKMVVEWD